MYPAVFIPNVDNIRFCNNWTGKFRFLQIKYSRLNGCKESSEVNLACNKSPRGTIFSLVRTFSVRSDSQLYCFSARPFSYCEPHFWQFHLFPLNFVQKSWNWHNFQDSVEWFVFKALLYLLLGTSKTFCS